MVTLKEILIRMRERLERTSSGEREIYKEIRGKCWEILELLKDLPIMPDIRDWCYKAIWKYNEKIINDLKVFDWTKLVLDVRALDTVIDYLSRQMTDKSYVDIIQKVRNDYVDALYQVALSKSAPDMVLGELKSGGGGT